MKTNTLQDKLDQVQKLYDAECERSEHFRKELVISRNSNRAQHEIIEDHHKELTPLRRIAEMARDAVEAGAIEECYLSLLRDAVSALPNTKMTDADLPPEPEPLEQTNGHVGDGLGLPR